MPLTPQGRCNASKPLGSSPPPQSLQKIFGRTGARSAGRRALSSPSTLQPASYETACGDRPFRETSRAGEVRGSCGATGPELERPWGSSPSSPFRRGIVSPVEDRRSWCCPRALGPVDIDCDAGCNPACWGSPSCHLCIQDEFFGWRELCQPAQLGICRGCGEP